MSLVTIVVVTYNSASFVAEALESVRVQTWNELELIITDDSSSDETIEICKRWLERNQDRFIRTELITSLINTGVSGNVNRGLNVAKGEWIKFLAADDALLPGCIEANMEHVRKNQHIKILFSRLNIYNDSFLPVNFVLATEDDSINPSSIMHPSKTADSQYKMLVVSDRIHYTPSAFFHRETLLSVGGFNERVRLMEDYPLWLKLTKSGYRLYFMDVVTANYRRHAGAANNKKQRVIVNPNYFNTEKFRTEYTYPALPFLVRSEQRINWILSQAFRWPYLNRDTPFNRLIYRLLTRFMNPFRYISFLYGKLKSDSSENELYH